MQVCVAADRGRAAVCGEDGLPVAADASGFPPRQSADQQFRTWRDRGIWEWNGKASREQGRKASLSQRGDDQCAVCQDGAKKGWRGYDAGKKIKNRMRYAQLMAIADTDEQVQHMASQLLG